MRLTGSTWRVFLNFCLIGTIGCSGSDPDEERSPTPTEATGTPVATPSLPPTPPASETPEPASPTPAVDLDGDGHTPARGDCDDADVTSHPGGVEHCDGRDNDCDGSVDEGELVGFPDADGDGFGSGEALDCTATVPLADNRGDCDETNPSVHPGAADAPGDGLDQDCGGTEAAEPHVGLGASSLESIQAALDAAVAGTTVWVGRGTYLEHDLTFRGKALALRSTGLASATVVDAQQEGRGFVFDGGEGPETLLDGFTVTGGLSDFGGGALVTGSSPTLQDCRFVGNRAGSADGSPGGGGLHFEASHTILTGCTVSDNQIDPGLEPAGGGGLSVVDSGIVLSRCIVSNNLSTLGGGIRMTSSSVEVEHSSIRDNFVANDYYYSGNGAGISIGQNSVLYVVASSIVGNHTVDTDGEGMGILAYSSQVFVDRSVIAKNGYASRGGGLSLYGTTALISRTLISDHEAGACGGIQNTESMVTLERALVSGNRATSVGGICVAGAESTLTLLNSVISANSGIDGSPAVGGIYAGVGAAVDVDHSIVAYNLGGSSSAGYNLYVEEDAHYASIVWSDLFNPEGDENNNLTTIGVGTVTVEPEFMSGTDFKPTDPHLAPGSPLADAGDPSQFDPDGTRADIGIFGGEDGDSWDLDCDGLPTWFWPGTFEDVPAGIDASKYDPDTVPLTSDWSTWPCLYTTD